MAEYIILKSGNILQKYDEYCTSGGVWRVIPPFMVGSAIPDCPSTKWRRTKKDGNDIVVTKSKKWYSFLFGK
jgi:hypothetical protein